MRLALWIPLVLVPAVVLAAPDASLTVRPGQELGRVNRLVFGNNQLAYDPGDIGPLWATDAYRVYGGGMWDPVARQPVPEAVRLTREMGMPIARFPGGCGVHGFDWKKTIGPPASRPDRAFGIDEWMTVCQATGSEVLITVSDYTGMPQDAADLVEYLNAPADAAHPWAQQRAANGHPEPYGVKWFELGNETWHGNHEMQPPRLMSGEEYQAWAADCTTRMKGVDPGVKIGWLLYGTPPDEATRGKADFIIVHLYGRGTASQDPSIPLDPSMREMASGAEELEASLADSRRQIRERYGRDLAVAITEWNVGVTAGDPVQYRWTLAAALFCADWVRVMLKPESNVLMANYWQYLNEYWGELGGPVQGEDVPYVKRPAYYVHQLYNNHFGDTLVAAECDTPTYASEIEAGLMAPTGNLLADTALRPTVGEGWQITTERDSLTWTLGDFSGSAYPEVAWVTHEPGKGAYRLTGEAKFEGNFEGGMLGIQMGDNRGWTATRSGSPYDGLQGYSDWTPLRLDYYPLRDTQGLVILMRCEHKRVGASGTLRLRNLKLEHIMPPEYPDTKLLTVTASKSADGNTLYLMVINRSLRRDLGTDVDLGDFAPRSAHLWRLSGPAMEATNDQDPNTCRVTDHELTAPARPLRLTFPAHSLTAVELRR